MGFYNHLLFKLQMEFKLTLDNFVDCFYQPYSSTAGTRLALVLFFLTWLNFSLNTNIIGQIKGFFTLDRQF